MGTTRADGRRRFDEEAWEQCYDVATVARWCPINREGRVPREAARTTPTAFSGLTFLHTVEEESTWTTAGWRGRLGKGAAWATGTSEVLPGHLIVDSAAGQALIGETACVRWEQKLNGAGLRGVQVHTKMATPKGVGGAAHPTRSMMMPTMIDGLPRVLQCTAVDEDIPRLLPLSSQEKQGALINVGNSRVSKQLPTCTARQEDTARSM